MLSLLNTTFTTAVRRGVTVIGTLLSKLKARSTYFENKSGTKTILQELEDDGLLSKASIVLTPTAYEVGSLNSVKPIQTFGSEEVTNGDFSTDSDWTKSNAVISGGKATVTITAGGLSYLLQSISFTDGKKYVVTADLQGTAGKAARLMDNGNNTGGLGTSNGEILLDGSSQSVEIEWKANSNSQEIAFIRATNSGDWSFTVDNVSIKEVIDGDFDFVRSSTATRVNASGQIESVASNVPRIDYSDGVGKILLEFTGTNVIPYSEDFSQWFNSETSDAANQTTSPDGTTNAARLTDTTATSNHIITSQGFTLSSGAATMSIFAKADTLSYLRLRTNGTTTGVRIWFDLSNGTVTHEDVTGAGKIEDYGNGWYRCSVTDSSNTNTGGGSLQVFLQNASGFQTTYTGDGSGSIYLWGGQYEQQSYMTSYIPTGSTTVTRVVDRANSSGNSTLINSVQGTIYFELSMFDTGTNDFMFLSQPGTTGNTNSIGVYGNFGGGITGQIKHAGGTTYMPIGSGSGPKLINTKFALRWGGGTIESYFEGTETATRSIPNGDYSAGDLTAFNFSAGSSPIKGKIKCMAIFPEALTDTELQNLTS
jgi:hypothetical protein